MSIEHPAQGPFTLARDTVDPYESLILRHEAAIADVVDRAHSVYSAWLAESDGAYEPPDCLVWAIDDLSDTFGVLNPRKPGKKGARK